jgi:hypothetical protein
VFVLKPLGAPLLGHSLGGPSLGPCGSAIEYRDRDRSESEVGEGVGALVSSDSRMTKDPLDDNQALRVVL